MRDIVLPHLNTNDEGAVLVRWHVGDGAPVTAGRVVATVETSKAAADLAAETDGILHHAAEEGETVPFGAVVGRIFSDAAEWEAFRPGREARPAVEEEDDLIVTGPARELLRVSPVPREALRALGRRVIRRADVEGLLGTPSRPAGGREPPPLEKNRRAVAAIVERSHRHIPKAFTLVRADCGLAIEGLKDLRRRVGVFVGLPEFLVRAVARLHPTHPRLFGRSTENGSWEPSATANIGITLDLGQGLYVPVLRSCQEMPLAEIARRLMSLRRKAQEGAFATEDLEGADIALSLTMEEGVVFTDPIILPPLVGMISVGSVVPLPRAGDPTRLSPHVHVGVAYDHRFVNGREAVLFLQALREAIEAPGVLDPS